MNHFRDKGINRIGNLLVPNNNYVKFEVIITVLRGKQRNIFLAGKRIRFWPKTRTRGSVPQTKGKFQKSIV